MASSRDRAPSEATAADAPAATSLGLQPVWALRRYAAAVVDAVLAAALGQMVVMLLDAVSAGSWTPFSGVFWLGAIIGYTIWSERRPGRASPGRTLLRYRFEADDVGVSPVWVIITRFILKVMALFTIALSLFLLLSGVVGGGGDTTEARQNLVFGAGAQSLVPVLILVFVVLALRVGLPGQTICDRLCGLRPVNRGPAAD